MDSGLVLVAAAGVLALVLLGCIVLALARRDGVTFTRHHRA
jgi:hypothetical protein